MAAALVAGGPFGPAGAAYGQCDTGFEVAVRVDVLVGKAPLAVQFRGAVIGDQAGQAQVQWDFDDGSFAHDDLVVSHVYSQAGSYLARFTATNLDNGCSASTSKFIQVNEDVNETPTARISAVFGEGDAPISVIFSSMGEDPDGRIILHEWSFGDGEFATGDAVVHNYQRNGAYLVRLTVTDDRGGKDFTIRSIEIGAGVSGLGSDLSTGQPNPTNTNLIAATGCGGLGAATLALTEMGLVALRLTGLRRRR